MWRLRGLLVVLIVLAAPFTAASAHALEGGFLVATFTPDGLGEVRATNGSTLLAAVATGLAGDAAVSGARAVFDAGDVRVVALDSPVRPVEARATVEANATFAFPDGVTLTRAAGGRVVSSNGGIVLTADGASLAIDGASVRARLPAGAAAVAIFPVDPVVHDLLLRLPLADALRGDAARADALREGTNATPAPDRLGVQRAVPAGQHVLHLRVAADAFGPVERLRQLVPEFDGDALAEGSFDFGVEVRRDEMPALSGDPGPFYNLTRAGDAYDLLVVVQGPGALDLTLRRDVVAPAVLGVDVSDVTPIGFLAVSTTDEPALATLEVWPRDDPSRVVPFPTTSPALRQTFPVQGLEADRAYAFRVTVRDFSGNTRVGDEHEVRTAAEPDVELPVVTSRSPAPDAVLAAPPEAVEATYETPVGRIEPESVRLFVDKTEVSHLAERGPARIRYAPASPFTDGLHSVGLEITNSEGGKAVATWKFTVGEADAPAPGLPALLLAALAVAAWVRRARL